MTTHTQDVTISSTFKQVLRLANVSVSRSINIVDASLATVEDAAVTVNLASSQMRTSAEIWDKSETAKKTQELNDLLKTLGQEA